MDNPDIIRVDFGSRKRVEDEDDKKAKAGVAEKQTAIHGTVRESLRIAGCWTVMDSMALLKRYGEFCTGLQGGMTGNTYRTARIDHQSKTVDELTQMLTQGEHFWKTKPQFYAAIADLLRQKCSEFIGGKK